MTNKLADKIHRDMLLTGKTFTEALVACLKQIGFYNFNRWMVKQGFKLEYTMAIHKLASKQ